jgi:hypothetical protein
LTALHPLPPIPTTLILANVSAAGFTSAILANIINYFLPAKAGQ